MVVNVNGPPDGTGGVDGVDEPDDTGYGILPFELALS
jgi:hypothetical protein